MFKNYEGFVIKYKYERIVIGPTVDTEGGGRGGKVSNSHYYSPPPPWFLTLTIQSSHIISQKIIESA